MGKSGFIRMREAKKSGQSPQGSWNLSGCEIRICPDAIYKNPDLSGCEMRRNPGNHIREIRIIPDAKSGEIRIYLYLLLAC